MPAICGGYELKKYLLFVIILFFMRTKVFAEEKVLLDVPAFDQREMGLPTGCEIVSVGMILNYTNEVNISDLVKEMPRSHNPNLGYRGSPYSYDGFTIFPQALVGIVEKYAGSAIDLSGCSIEDLKAQIGFGVPIAAWVNGLGFNVHCIALTGFDKSGFFYNDPWTGEKNVHIGFDYFYRIWNKTIYDEIDGTPYSTRKALSYAKKTETSPELSVPKDEIYLPEKNIDVILSPEVSSKNTEIKYIRLNKN